MRKPWTIADFALIWLGGMFASLLVAALFFEGDASLGLVTILSLAGQYVGILLVFWLLLRLKREADPVGLRVEPSDVLYVGLGMLLNIVVVILVQPLARLVYPEGRSPQEITEILGSPDVGSEIRLAFFVAAVVFTPLTEELLYRGVLFQAMRRRGPQVAIVVSAVVFTLVHLTGLDPDNMAGSAAVVLPPLFGLGLFLAWLTNRRGRLGPALFIHSGWNLLTTLLVLVPSDLVETVGLLS